MKQYFFLASFLPSLQFHEKPAISFEELKIRLKVNLTEADYRLAGVLFSFVDISNIRALLMEEPIDPKGNLSEKELDEALLLKYNLPDYVFEFLDGFESSSEKIRHFSGVFSAFFNHEIGKRKGFLKKYFSFERDLRLVTTALRSKILKRDVIKELQFEDLSDPLIMQILAQKDADQYDPPAEYAEVKTLLSACEGNPWKERMDLDEYRFNKIYEMVEGELFSIDRILAYCAQLSILEYGLELDRDKGKMILDTFKTS